MRLGISSWALAWNIGVPGHHPTKRLDAHGLLDFAAEHNVAVVQIADNLPLQALSDPQLLAVRDHARQLQLSLEVGTRGIAPAHRSRLLEICRVLASPILRIVIDSANHEPAADEIIESFRRARPEFEAAGVRPAIENHDRFDSKTFAQMIESIGPEYAGICLDTVNSFGALEGPDIVIRTLAPYTINLHVKDFVVRRHPSLMGFEIVGAPAGRGRLDIPALLSTIQQHNPACTAVLEQWPPPQSEPDATAAMEREWAVESIAYLRKAIGE
ncbi:MAG TPA: TIM barrel protein [Bryobacteraceae bacterium]|nr:TIM barrel protein [Bryobacteraceae bacterium]